MKKVLVISYDFPPRRTSGVYRMTHLTRYLLDRGWHPTVLTVERSENDVEDLTLFAKLPCEMQVERARDLKISGWEGRAAEGIRAIGGLKSTVKDTVQPPRDRWIRKMGDYVRSLLYFPDEMAGWIPGAITRAVELHMQQRFDAVYTTSPPRSDLVVGLLFQILFNVPWIVELRDPWDPPPKPWRAPLEHRLFASILRKAAQVVVISRGHAAHLAMECGVPPSKISMVSNGYEEDDFVDLSNGAKCDFLPPGFLHLSHFGTVYSGYSGRFFDALAVLIRERPELKQKIRVNVIGFPDDVVRAASVQAELKEVVRIHRFVPHDVAIDAMRRSDVLLVFLADREIARLSGLGKIYDYLRVGKPVLAVANEGGTAELVREGGGGWVVDPESTQSLIETLRFIVHDASGEVLRKAPSQEFVSQFRFDRLAGKLAEVLESVTKNGRQA